MESSSSAGIAGLHPNCLICPSSRNPRTLFLTHFAGQKRHFIPPSSLKLQRQFAFAPCLVNQTDSCFKRFSVSFDALSNETIELADIDWDELVFGFSPTDYMYVMKCGQDGNFSEGQLQRFGNIELSPSSGVLNYGQVLKAQSAAKAKGYSDVLYLDCVHKRYLEEVSSCNIFVVKDNVISTPAIKGTILPGITRKSIVEVARSQGLQVEERLVTVEELLDADEVFCTGTAVVVSPVGSITCLDKRVSYREDGFGAVSRQLYSALTQLQMGLVEDKMNWTLELN